MTTGAAQGEGSNQAGGSNPSRSTIKRIRVEPIGAQHARFFIKREHYSGRVVPNSNVHLGAFLDGKLHGVMQFGPPMNKRATAGLVRDTEWNGLIELNRMAFTDALPRNAESRCIGIALRLLKQHNPALEWVISFADATQCGDGTIYRASNFVLTGIKKNNSILKMADGSIRAKITFGKSKHAVARGGKTCAPEGSSYLPGFQLRYIYFYTATARARLTVNEVPFSAIREAGATMYKGKAREVGDGSAPPGTAAVRL